MPRQPKRPTIHWVASDRTLPPDEGWAGPAVLCTVQLHLQHWLKAWVAQYRKDIKLLEGVQKRAMKKVKGLEGKMYKEQLKSLTVFSPEQRKLRGGLVAAPQQLCALW